MSLLNCHACGSNRHRAADWSQNTDLLIQYLSAAALEAELIST